MLDQINGWMKKLTGAADPSGEVEAYAGDDPRLSVAAILVHIIAVDGVITDDEKRRLREVLATHYALTPRETEDLVSEASRREDDAVDLYTFTSVLKRQLDEDGRRQFVELMWEMVYADGEVSEFEDNVVWRVAELIGISTRERVALRQRIEARQGGEAR